MKKSSFRNWRIATFTALSLSMLADALVLADDAGGHPLTILEYVDGETWIAGAGPGDQDLQDHFGYVVSLSREGKLIGNGLLESDRPHGFYLLDVPHIKDGEDIVGRDPGNTNGVLKQHEMLTWLVVTNGFGHANLAHGDFFRLDYHQGPKWVKGKSLVEQDLTQHFAYVAGLFSSGRLIGGGPILQEDRGLYIVKTPHRAMAEGIVSSDPGVKAGIFTVTIRKWSPGELRALN